MASWVSHFRIAQAVLARGFSFERGMFAMGNIAPDSGLVIEGSFDYNPPKQVSHWRGEHQIEPDRFYEEQLAGQRFNATEYAFRAGYYCHLLTDRIWSDTVWRPKKQTPLYAELLAQDLSFIHEIKKDWYGLDMLYLQQHPHSIFFTDVVPLQTIPDYMPDVFPDGAFNRRLQETRTFYLSEPDWELNRPYIYLNQQEWDDFIAHAADETCAALHVKAIG